LSFEPILCRIFNFFDTKGGKRGVCVCLLDYLW